MGSGAYRPVRQREGGVSERWFKLVRIEAVREHELLGWLGTPDLLGTPHARYAVLMIWPCACKMVVPV